LKEERREKLRSKVISRIVKVNIEVAGYYKFMRSGGSKRLKFIKVMQESVVTDGICR